MRAPGGTIMGGPIPGGMQLGCIMRGIICAGTPVMPIIEDVGGIPIPLAAIACIMAADGSCGNVGDIGAPFIGWIAICGGKGPRKDIGCPLGPIGMG